MPDQIRDLDKLLDMQEYSAFIIEHTPKSEDDFFANRVLQLGILKSLENIGEAAYKISEETKKEFTQLEWKNMIAARHVYVHDYFKIDWKKVWESITTIDFNKIISDADIIIQH